MKVLPRFPIAMLLVLVWAGATLGQEPPLAGRPTNFSGAVGRFTIQAEAAPNEVIVEQPITLRVVITGDDVAVAPARKTLRLFTDEIAENFFVEPVTDNDRADPQKNSWMFVWKLRPKSVDVIEIPSLALSYFSPAVRRYQTARSEPIDLVVRPRSEPSPAFDLASAPITLRTLDLSPSRASRFDSWPWVAVAVAVSCLSWWLAGIWVNSNNIGHDARLTRVIDAMRRRPDEAPELFTAYLSERLATPIAVPAADDIDRLLRQQGIRPDIRREIQSWLRDFDRRRYAPKTIVGYDSIEIPPSFLKPLGTHLSRIGAILGIVFTTAMVWADDASPRNEAIASFMIGVEQFGQPGSRERFEQSAIAFADDVRAEPDRAGHYQNLGNALALAGRWPDAIAVFRAGLAIDRDSVPLRDNLAFSRQQVRLPESSRLTAPQDSWDVSWPWSAIRIGFVFSLLAAGLAIPVGIRLQRRAWIGISLGILALTLGSLLELRRNVAIDDVLRPVVVIARETPFRVGNGEAFASHPESAMLPAGYEVRRLHERGGWRQVECPGGQVGWVVNEAIAQPPTRRIP